jgi:hypothetical protein
MQFKKAVKYDAKGRVALVGPAGSGKSYTMLRLARTLAGAAGTIAAIDTEHGSLSKYADLFDFDVIELDSFTPDNFLNALAAAEAEKYDVFCCDSLSHFWMGKDGALEFTDMRAKYHKDRMGGWKDFSPLELSMVNSMVASPCHIIVTMRTKTEYVEEIDQRTGKKKRVKIGLMPVQRAGLEYEFDLVAYMDDENNLITDKTRCPHYTGKALAKPSEKDFAPFQDWLKGAKRDAVAMPQAAPQHAAVPPQEAQPKPAAHPPRPQPQPAATPAPSTELTKDQIEGELARLGNFFYNAGQQPMFESLRARYSDGGDRPKTLKQARALVAALQAVAAELEGVPA